MRDAVAKVREFHERFAVPVRDEPTVPPPDEAELQRALIREEVEEFMVASRRGDVVEIADALADIAYLVAGTALAYGIPLADVFDEVHRSNLTKCADRRADGKIMKGEEYEPPMIADVLGRGRGNPVGSADTKTRQRPSIETHARAMANVLEALAGDIDRIAEGDIEWTNSEWKALLSNGDLARRLVNGFRRTIEIRGVTRSDSR